MILSLMNWLVAELYTFLVMPLQRERDVFITQRRVSSVRLSDDDDDDDVLFSSPEYSTEM